MRPQDIVVLVKIIALGESSWKYSDLSESLVISLSEISACLNRCKTAKLIGSSKKEVFKSNLLDFLVYGLKYVFPAAPGEKTRGIATAHSAKPLSDIIVSDEIYVWPTAKGDKRGFAVKPLYKTVPLAARKDEKLYELLALVDAIRTGRAREHKIAEELLNYRIKEGIEKGSM